MWQRWFFLWLALMRLIAAFASATWQLRWKFQRTLAIPPGIPVSAKEQRRMRHYFLGTTYLRAVFCSIRGRSASANEACMFARLSALASLFDDLADQHRHETTQAIDMQAFASTTDARGLALYLLNSIRDNLSAAQKPMFEACLQRVFQAELTGMLSVSQSDSKYLKFITAEKGGSSVLLFRSLLAPAPTQEEADAIMTFGYLIQLSDDIFDVWFDKQAGVKTLATKLLENNQVQELKDLWERKWLLTKESFSLMGVSLWRKNIVLAELFVLVAITRTCLEHYNKLGATIPLEHRQQMVVDMSLWKNRFRVLQQLLKKG
jgi:hypothetical protein